MEEIFKPIDGFNEQYFISNYGNVKSNKTNRLLKIQKSSGYSTITLSNNYKTNRFLVHRLVANAFIPNPENKPTVNHINHDTYDNRVENLEWNTHKEQNEHNYKTQDKKRTTRRARSISCYKKDNELCKTFRTLTEASEWLYKESTSKNVEACLAGIRHSLNNGGLCHNYIWKYNDLEIEPIENEEWKEIPDEFTLGKKNYWLSNKGRFKNNMGKLMEFTNETNYISISFKNKEKNIQHQLHRIIAFMFVENPDNKPFVNHLDGNKSNNCADNLEWVTKSENTLHAHKTCLIKKKMRKIHQFDKNGNFIAEYESIKKAAVILNLDKSSIGHVCAKDRPGSNTCGGFVFKYADKHEILISEL
jgi:hypothetical protein